MILRNIYQRAACISNPSALITNISQRSIVKSYVKRKSIYETCIPFDEHWIPYKNKKNQKKNIPQWDDPNTLWPPLSVRPTKHTGRTLIDQLQQQQIQKIKNQRPFTIPHVQTGDVVEVYKFKSISSGKLDEYRGLVIGTQKFNKLGGRITILGSRGNQQYFVGVMLYSPLIAKINILKYGSNNMRAKQMHYAKKGLSKGQMMSPIIKGKAKVGKASRDKFQRMRYLMKLKRKGVDIGPLIQEEKQKKNKQKDSKQPRNKYKTLEEKKSVLDDFSIASVEQQTSNK